MSTRFLSTVLGLFATLGLLACDQAEQPLSAEKGKVVAERVASNALHVNVVAPAKDVPQMAAIARPALSAASLSQTWVDDPYSSNERTEFLVNEETAATQEHINIACNQAVANIMYDDGDGTYDAGEYEARGACIAVWTSDEGGVSTGKDVFARRLINSQYALDADTDRDIYGSAAVKVNTITTSTQHLPSVAWTPDNANGNYVVVWESSEAPTLGKDIWMQRYDKDDAAIGVATKVNTDVDATNQQEPVVAMDNAGNFVVAWRGQDGNNDGIVARRFDSNGTPTAPFVVNEYTTGSQKAPAIAMNAATGDFVVAWQSSQLLESGEIYARQYAAAGTATTSETLVNAFTLADQKEPDVGMADDGALVVTWQGKVDGTPGVAADYNVFYRRLHEATGAFVFDDAADALVSTVDPGLDDQIAPKVTVNPDGGFAIGFVGVDSQLAGVYYRRYKADGTNIQDLYWDTATTTATATGSVKTNEIVAGYQDNVAIATIRVASEEFAGDAPGSSIIVAWDSTTGGTLDSGGSVWARRYSVDDDGDGYGWDSDNCKGLANTQEDDDNDLRGNVCDNCIANSCSKTGKADGDGNPQTKLWCGDATAHNPSWTTENYDQADNDVDGLGNVCDNCVDLANGTQVTNFGAQVNLLTTQIDFDLDGEGDTCDTDDDDDGVPDVDEDAGPDDDHSATTDNGNANPDGDKTPGAPTADYISRHDDDSDGDTIDDPTEYNGACDTVGVAYYGATAADHDCDGDLALNNFDTDSDADSIPDAFELTGENEPASYEDGFGNWLDGDSNGDTVTDFHKVHDANGVLLDYATLATGAFPDADTWNLDGDTFPDHIDADMDNDGILDVDENQISDGNGAPLDPLGNQTCFNARTVGAAPEDIDLATDGTANPDGFWNWQDLDSDGDGVLDATETINDMDGDDICAFADRDSDNDGIIDDHESGTTKPACGDDCDGVGDVNSLDLDSDDDGISDNIEFTTSQCACTDNEGDPLFVGVNNSCAGDDNMDCDNDGVENWVDADSDDDGIPDAHENGSDMPTNMAAKCTGDVHDCDGDGAVNSQDNDADGDGVLDAIELIGDIEPTPDGYENWYDDDSDGDGMSDSHESGKTRPICLGDIGHKSGAFRLACTTGAFIPDNVDGTDEVNSLDFDSDNDGILDSDENGVNNTKSGTVFTGIAVDGTTADADGDGIENWWDLDSDADWILDSYESGGTYPGIAIQHDIDAGYDFTGDFDGDGTLNAFDEDSDGDGVADFTESKNACGTLGAGGTSVNCDGDVWDNYWDLDSDGDGILDSEESGTAKYNNATPAAGMCGYNAAPGDNETAPYMSAANEDCDGDGKVNSQDNDADDDGVLDDEEYMDEVEDDSICDSEVEGYAGDQNDCDGDGHRNWYDDDSDGDTITDSHESGFTNPIDALGAYCTTLDYNDNAAAATADDCDADGIFNSMDSDTDGDGILDSEEGETYVEPTNCYAGSPAAPGGPDSMEPWYDNDSDGDGILDKVETDANYDATFAASDADKNYKDCDSDGDAIADAVETDNDADNDGDMNFLDLDSDNDGIIDEHECDMDGAGIAVGNTTECSDAPGWTHLPRNFDGDGQADYLDEDSDQDGIADKHEQGNDKPAGLTDAYCLNKVVGALAPAVAIDCDGDGDQNYNDLDSDEDGIADSLEWANEPSITNALGAFIEHDMDEDGLEGWYDNDSDGDGIADWTEKADKGAGTFTSPAEFDTDMDGVINSFDLDTDADTIADAYECAMGAVCECVADTCDLAHEAADPDGGAAIATPWNTDAATDPDYMDSDSDEDGVSDLIEANGFVPPSNTDGDNWDDYLDSDSDNDGVQDPVDNCPIAYNDEQDNLDGDTLGDVCDPDYHVCDELEEGQIVVGITSPTNFQLGLDSGTDATLTVPVAFTVSGSSAAGLRIFVDERLYALETPVPASPYNVDVPFGQHTIALVATDDYGTPWNGCTAAQDSVLIRVGHDCVVEADCDDGNDCSADNCEGNGKCGFGPTANNPLCCNSEYDCDYMEICLDRDDDSVDTKACVGCDRNDASGAGNCPTAVCKQAQCGTPEDSYACGFSDVATCCEFDHECNDCQDCDYDEVLGEGTCVKSAAALALEAEGKRCCTQSDGVADDNTWGCNEAPVDDKCTIQACIGAVCRYGPTYFGCCDADADCDNAGKINVCNDQGGYTQCVNIDGDGQGYCDYGADADHRGCCFNNVDCVRALIEEKAYAVDAVVTTCNLDADCTNAPYDKCFQGVCTASCLNDSQCSTVPDNNDRCLSTGICGKKYPFYTATCDLDTDLGGWFGCDYEPNPNICDVQKDLPQVPRIVITELAVDPTEGSSYEWIELFNTTPAVIDIAGYFINDDEATGGPLALNNRIGDGTTQILMRPGKPFVICRDPGVDMAAHGVSCDFTMAAGTAWGLSNGDTVEFFGADLNADGDDDFSTGAALELIDAVAYPAGKVSKGYSLALAHPYADNADETYWFSDTKGGVAMTRNSYNGTNFGTPGIINNDVFDKDLLDSAAGEFIAICDDGKDCTVGICNANAPNYCAQVTMSTCCDATKATDPAVASCTLDSQCTNGNYTICDTNLNKCVDKTALSGQCSDGVFCTADTCDTATWTCASATPDEGCCETNEECADFYPTNLDLNVDLVGTDGTGGPDGALTTADVDAIKATFDELANKKCIAHGCRYRKDAAKADGCISSDYALGFFGCNDVSSCTQNQCVCSSGDPADCRNGDQGAGGADDGYYKCDFSAPIDAADACCYTDADCCDPDDSNPDGNIPDCEDNMIYECEQIGTDGQPVYRCKAPELNLNWCDDDADCTATATACETPTCDLGTNKCANVTDATKEGCCASNAECVQAEVNGPAGMNLSYTINVCCEGLNDALGTDTTLDGFCTAENIEGDDPTAFAKCGVGHLENFCDTAADCVALEGKKCLTSYCIAHRCRFGLPYLDDADIAGMPAGTTCCEDAADCNDANDCTVDSCEVIGGSDLGYCKNEADAAKTDCCVSLNDTNDAYNCSGTVPGNECENVTCQFSGADGYKKCTVVDMLDLGLCCTQNSDCDDSNACTLDACVNNQCRLTKPNDACCTAVNECPLPGDPGSQRVCTDAANPAGGSCELGAMGAVVSLPYSQDFEFAQDFYNNYTNPALVSWTPSGDLTGQWVVNPPAALGGIDKQLVLQGDGNAATSGACIALPTLNTLGASAAVVGWFQDVALDGGGQDALVLTVQARRGADAWSVVKTISASDELGQDYYVQLGASFLGATSTQVRFCATADTLAAGTSWAIDDVVVVRGHLPTLVTNITDKSVAVGDPLPPITVDAYDVDFDNVTFSLVTAPAFISLENYHTASVDTVTHFYVDITGTAAECDVTVNNVYEITLKVSDGYVNTYETFNLSVTGCTSD